jgi:hypothetical protein
MKYIAICRKLVLAMIPGIIGVAGYSQQPFYNSKEFRLYSWDNNVATEARMRSTPGTTAPWGIMFSIDNQEKMSIFPNGQVAVHGPGAGGTIRLYPDGDSEAGIGLYGTLGSSLPWIVSQGGWNNNGKLVFGYNGSRMLIQQDGNVGIATTTPAYKLDVNGSGRFYNDLYTQGSIGIGTVFAPSHKLTIASPDINAVRLIGPYGSVGYGARLNFGDGNYSYIEEGVDDQLNLFARNGVVVNSNVGIGTSSASALTIRGAGNSGTLRILPNVDDGESGIGLYGKTTVTDYPWVISQGGWGNVGKLVFGYNGPRMVVQQNGNVGIGLVAPQAKLDVSGDGRFNGNYLIGSDITRFNNIPAAKKASFSLWVEKGVVANDFAVGAPTTWADYVFATDYKLRPLHEVAAFIQAEHHLPDMPAEATIKKEGYSLHDMNTRLLQKIEELTLYTIEHQKEIDALRKQVAAYEQLKQEIEEMKTLLKKAKP